MGNFETLATKMLFDPQFAELMKRDPAAALQELGIEPTAERLNAIKQVDADAITRAASVIGAGQKSPPN
jgi:hypothetical protein